MLRSAMTTLRIRIKTGEHEFEAEGPADDVSAQIVTFLRLLGRDDLTGLKPAAASTPPQPRLDEDLSSLIHVSGKQVSLNVSSGSPVEDVLLLLLGQQQLRGNTSVAGNEIMEGLRASGYQIPRADHIMKRHASIGFIVATGKRRRRRYRLTTDGIASASKIAQRLSSSTPQVR
jgi:hypothetical protein